MTGGADHIELRDRLLAPAGLRNAAGEVVDCDIGAVLRRLLLFEDYILDSYGMRELPALIDALGANGFLALLDAKVLRIRADATTVAQIGQTDLVKGTTRFRDPLPLGSYAFGHIVLADREEHISRCLGEIRGMEIGNRTSQKLRRAIVDSLVPPSAPGGKAFDQFAADVAANVPTLKRATAVALSKQLGKPVVLNSFELRIEEHDEIYRAESDIAVRFGLEPEHVHRVVERGLLGALSVNRRLEEMELYGTLMGFLEDEVPIFEEKLSFLAAQLDPDKQEARFDRVVTIAGLPDLGAATPGSINIERLLEIRASEECREFRSWLRTLDSATDEEIAERLASIRERIASAVHSDVGKAVRLVTTTGIGLIPIVGPIAGVVAGALDQFALEKLVPEPGPISFLGRSYPSIFTGR